MTTRRTFLKGAAVAAPAALATPAIVKAQTAIKWRWQTYAGAALGEHVTKPIVDYINNAANGEMEVELFYADQIVPTGELFQALQRGTIRGAPTSLGGARTARCFQPRPRSASIGARVTVWRLSSFATSPISVSSSAATCRLRRCRR